jgi:hypothetical protein
LKNSFLGEDKTVVETHMAKTAFLDRQKERNGKNSFANYII